MAEREAEKDEFTYEYDQIRETWQCVLNDAKTTSYEYVKTPRITGAIGDEAEDSDVVSKIKERIYRIGSLMLT